MSFHLAPRLLVDAGEMRMAATGYLATAIPTLCMGLTWPVLCVGECCWYPLFRILPDNLLYFHAR